MSAPEPNDSDVFAALPLLVRLELCETLISMHIDPRPLMLSSHSMALSLAMYETRCCFDVYVMY
jgi:hypothetical protein